MFIGKIYLKLLLLPIVTATLLLFGCSPKVGNGSIVISSISSNTSLTNFRNIEDRYDNLSGSLVAIDPENLTRQPIELTADFFSAAAPDISDDGKKIVFTARSEEKGRWQIWEMELANLKKRVVTPAEFDAVDPVYLPGERIAFTMITKSDLIKSESALYVCNIDGSGLYRITFAPHSYYSSSILADGRIVSLSRKVFPENGNQELLVMRPDGTKAELFYLPGKGNTLLGGVREASQGMIYMIESPSDSSSGGNIISVKYNRPLHSRTELTSEDASDYISVMPYMDEKLLVSCKKSTDENYSLYIYNTESNSLGEQIISLPGKNITGALAVSKATRPKKLPSEVDYGVKTGLLLVQNISISGMVSPEELRSMNIADRIEIAGVDSSMGSVKPAADGSVYLKIVADKPFRLTTYDSNGKVIYGPGSWLYLRPNERRGCVGCHSDPEITPANRYSLAVGIDPVSVPVNMKIIKEKEVELE